MPRNDDWTSISIKREQFDIIDKIHRTTRLKKNDILELALMEKYPEYFPTEAFEVA
jgi:hypothetical protein